MTRWLPCSPATRWYAVHRHCSQTDSVTHIARSEHVDAELAQHQWDGYVRALSDAGWTTHEVPAAPDSPDSAFVEDTMVVYGDVAVIGRPGAEQRWPEIPGAADTVCEFGYRLAHIEAPGTLDGGDVLKHGGTVWVGRGGRSNDEGIAQLTAHLEPFGATVIAVPLTKALHLKSAVTALPDGTVIGFAPVVDDPASGAIGSSRCPRSRERTSCFSTTTCS